MLGAQTFQPSIPTRAAQLQAISNTSPFRAIRSEILKTIGVSLSLAIDRTFKFGCKKEKIMKRTLGISALLCSFLLMWSPSGVKASGGTETIKVTKCFFMPGASASLIKASSTNSAAHLYAYLPNGEFWGEVQNGGGGKYGGSVMGYIPNDPINVTIKSSSGAEITVPTTPFQL